MTSSYPTLFDWRAARSGASITIHGARINGVKVKITEVILIETAHGICLATTKAGEIYRLSI